MRKITKRDPKGNKGTFGKVLVIAGSREMCGAAILCAKAVMASGAGMVKIFTESSNRMPALVSVPEAMVSLWNTGEPLPVLQLKRDLEWADAAVIGPGLSGSEEALAILNEVLEVNRIPLILDADALNLLAAHPNLLARCGEHCIFTPHIGEMARLCGKTAEELKRNPAGEAFAFAKRHQICCVMKDAVTVTASGGESKIYYNESGCSALATAGSGDVLAGIIGGFAAQAQRDGKTDLALYASLAVYAHGLAGEEAARMGSEASVTASDVIRALSAVLSQ